jgi:hypothetical protein
MKNVLPWIKAHLVFVILMVVAVVAFPVMFVISSGMNAKVRTSVEDDIRAQARELNALNVSYSVEPVVPGAEGFTATRPPNAATTEALRALIGQSAEQVQRAREAVVAFNRNAFKPIVDGLFPKPEASESVAKRDAMARRWVQWNTQMLADAGAGSPPPAAEVARRVEERRLREVDRLVGVDPSALTPEIEAELREILSRERQQVYQAPAQQSILFYASPDALASVAPYTGTSVPDLDLTWEWQWISWVNQMVVDAIRAANEPSLAVIDAPIKRLERLEVEPFAYPAEPRPPVGDVTGEIPTNFSASLSGRAYDPAQPNALYDARYATVRMIVASRRLPEILDAFARSNLITVIDLDVASLDERQALAEAGYAFGGDHLVRVHMRLETLWLREWTREFMPPAVRARLGVQPPEGQQNEDAAGNPIGGAAQADDGSSRQRGRRR